MGKRDLTRTTPKTRDHRSLTARWIRAGFTRGSIWPGGSLAFLTWPSSRAIGFAHSTASLARLNSQASVTWMPSGAAIWLDGLVGAALIHVFAADDGDTGLAGEFASGRMNERNLDLMGGKFAVYASQFNH